MRPILIAITFASSVPLMAAAHGSGISYEKEAGGYLVDISYDPASFIEGSAAVFDFALIDQVSGQPILLDEIWVRIKAGEQTVLATGLRVDDTVKTTLLYAFKTNGNYALSASFRRDGETLAEAEFPFVVEKGESEAPRSVLRYAGMTVSAVALLVVGFFLGRTQKRA